MAFGLIVKSQIELAVEVTGAAVVTEGAEVEVAPNWKLGVSLEDAVPNAGVEEELVDDSPKENAMLLPLGVSPKVVPELLFPLPPFMRASMRDFIAFVPEIVPLLSPLVVLDILFPPSMRAWIRLFIASPSELPKLVPPLLAPKENPEFPSAEDEDVAAGVVAPKVNGVAEEIDAAGFVAGIAGCNNKIGLISLARADPIKLLQLFSIKGIWE